MSSATDPGVDVAGARGDEVETAAAAPIVIAGGGEVRVGTASWTDPTMTASGVFYPTAATTAPRSASSTTPRPSRWSRSMPRTTRCRPPRPPQLWVDRTPPDFVFDIKAHALMTGQGTETKRLPKSIREASSRAGREQDAGSTPRTSRPSCSTRSGGRSARAWSRSPRPASSARSCSSTRRWFFPSSENRAAIETAVERLDGWRCAVEFRNGSWLNEKNAERTLAFPARPRDRVRHGRRAAGLQEQRPAGDAVTCRTWRWSASTAAMPQTWEAQGHHPGRALPLPLLARRARRVGRARSARRPTEARETHVLMNNCYANYGTTNARELAALLAGELAGLRA